MKRLTKLNTLAIIAAGLFFSTIGLDSLQAQDSLQVRNQYKKGNRKQNKGADNRHFVDLNGDGINDNAPDADGDGIPNGIDPDFTGSKNRPDGKGFVDKNGDGVNDNAQDFDGDGIPNGQDPDYVRPQDGSGQQKGNKGQGGKKVKGGQRGGGKR